VITAKLLIGPLPVDGAYVAAAMSGFGINVSELMKQVKVRDDAFVNGIGSRVGSFQRAAIPDR